MVLAPSARDFAGYACCLCGVERSRETTQEFPSSASIILGPCQACLTFINIQKWPDKTNWEYTLIPVLQRCDGLTISRLEHVNGGTTGPTHYNAPYANFPPIISQIHPLYVIKQSDPAATAVDENLLTDEHLRERLDHVRRINGILKQPPPAPSIRAAAAAPPRPTRSQGTRSRGGESSQGGKKRAGPSQGGNPPGEGGAGAGGRKKGAGSSTSQSKRRRTGDAPGAPADRLSDAPLDALSPSHPSDDSHSSASSEGDPPIKGPSMVGASWETIEGWTAGSSAAVEDLLNGDPVPSQDGPGKELLAYQAEPSRGPIDLASWTPGLSVDRSEWSSNDWAAFETGKNLTAKVSSATWWMKSRALTVTAGEPPRKVLCANTCLPLTLNVRP